MNMTIGIRLGGRERTQGKNFERGEGREEGKGKEMVDGISQRLLVFHFTTFFSNQFTTTNPQ